MYHFRRKLSVGNESVPKIIINDSRFFFLKLQSAFRLFKTITVSECYLIKLLRHLLFEKYINILALEMASPGNRHCASCIGALSFHVFEERAVQRTQPTLETWC